MRRAACQHVFIDATFCKAPVGRRVVPPAVVVAVGAASDGRRHVLRFDIDDTESEGQWGSSRFVVKGGVSR